MDYVLYVGNDNLITVDALTDQSTGEYINDGTVTMRLLDADGTQLLGATALTYTPSSDGKYTGVIEEDIALVANEKYQLEISVTASGDRVAKATRSCWARARAA